MSQNRKGVPTQRDIARLLDLDVSTVNKILRDAPGPAFNKHTVRKVWQAAEEIGYDLHRLKHQHRRAEERRFGRKAVTLAVYHPDGRVADEGRGTLVEISRAGARLDHVRLQHVQLNGFSIGLRLDGGEVRGRLARVFGARRMQSIALVFQTPLADSVLDRLPGFNA